LKRFDKALPSLQRTARLNFIPEVRGSIGHALPTTLQKNCFERVRTHACPARTLNKLLHARHFSAPVQRRDVSLHLWGFSRNGDPTDSVQGGELLSGADRRRAQMNTPMSAATRPEASTIGLCRPTTIRTIDTNIMIRQ
jgi:hypothetical protein